jgi:hypothetical protein
MTTDEIIDALNHLTIAGSEDCAQLDRLDELIAQLQQNHDGQLACAAMLHGLERHPQGEFGAPGPLVHAIESYRGHYENLLLAFLNRQPTATSIWLLNRIMNAAIGAESDQFVAPMYRLRTHPLADRQAQVAAEEFYRFQTGQAWPVHFCKKPAGEHYMLGCFARDAAVRLEN